MQTNVEADPQTRRTGVCVCEMRKQTRAHRFVTLPLMNMHHQAFVSQCAKY